MTGLQVDSSYGDLVWRLMLMAFGHGARDGAGDRVDHGLAAARQGRRRLRGQRHHPPDRWRARCRDRRQRDVVDVRVEDRATSSPARRARAPRPSRPRRTRSAARSRSRAKAPAGARASTLAAGAPSRRSSTACTPACSSAAGAAFLGAIVAAIWLPARARDGRPSSAGGRVRRGARARRRPHRGPSSTTRRRSSDDRAQVVDARAAPGPAAQRRGRRSDPRRRDRRVHRARLGRAHDRRGRGARRRGQDHDLPALPAQARPR